MQKGINKGEGEQRVSLIGDKEVRVDWDKEIGKIICHGL